MRGPNSNTGRFRVAECSTATETTITSPTAPCVRATKATGAGGRRIDGGAGTTGGLFRRGDGCDNCVGKDNPDQRDTDSLPPYEELDPIIEAYVEEDLPFDAIVARGHDEATVRRVIDMINRNEYKRRQSPPGVKITPRNFGRDRRLPLASKYRGY